MRILVAKKVRGYRRPAAGQCRLRLQARSRPFAAATPDSRLQTLATTGWRPPPAPAPPSAGGHRRRPAMNRTGFAPFLLNRSRRNAGTHASCMLRRFMKVMTRHSGLRTPRRAAITDDWLAPSLGALALLVLAGQRGWRVYIPHRDSATIGTISRPGRLRVRKVRTPPPGFRCSAPSPPFPVPPPPPPLPPRPVLKP